jgi:sugar O-acyltransferase (sialic acid O-acetyltransferase NeuD family)
VSGILILGAGGHAKVVADILLARGEVVAGLLDDAPARWRTMQLGVPVLGAIDSWREHDPTGLVIGIGDNRARRDVAARLGAAAQDRWRSAVHPAATLAPSVRLGRGVVVAAGVVVNPDAELGDHAIVNTAASVDHDCVVGAYAHIAPGARLAGGVTVGAGALVGIGAVVLPGCAIGAWAVVGAGAVVARDIPPNVVAKGVPARWSETPTPPA